MNNKNINTDFLKYLPKHYADIIDYSQHFSGLRTTKVKAASNGFIVHQFSHYITTVSTKFTFGKCGTMKAKGIYKKNYQPDVRFTEYYNSDLEQITLKEYQLLNK